jgi:protoheme IX farnesyltransferase
MADTVRLLYSVFKLRIGLAITLTALAGLAVTPGAAPEVWQIIVLAVAVLVSSASAGAFNQYVERDLDARMARTRNRPFVTGRYQPNGYWLAGIALMLLAAVAGAALGVNAMAALYVFLGAFVYGVVYTVWLKRRTWLNIVVGGLAGSFAVLAVPMLPVVVGNGAAARIILVHTVVLVCLSLVPAALGLGWIYLLGAVSGGTYFVAKSIRLARTPSRANAVTNFHASLIQLSLLLAGALLDGWASW